MTLYLAALLLLMGWLSAEHFPPWISWHAEVTAFMAIFLLSARWLWLTSRSATSPSLYVIRLPALGLALLGVIVLLIIQVLTGKIQFAGDAVVIGLYLALCLAAVALGFASSGSMPMMKGFAHQPDPIVLLASTLTAGAVLSAIAAWVQVLDIWESNSWIIRMPTLRRPGGNLSQPNQLATLLLMGMASLVYLSEKKRLGTASTGLIFLLIASGMVLTESRTGLLSLLTLLAWWIVGKKRVGFSLRITVVVCAVVMILLAYWAWPKFMWLVEVGAPGGSINTRGGMRMVVWPQLWQAVMMQPWTGWGLREVSTAHNAVAHGYATGELFTYSHNILLDMALGMGLPLTLLTVLGAGIWLLNRARAIRSLNAWYCLAVFIPLGVHSMLELPFAYAYFLAPAMFLLGRLEAEVGRSIVWQIRLRWAIASFLIAITLGLVSVVEYLKVEEDYRVIRFESLRMGSTSSDYIRPQIFLLTQMAALLDGARVTPARNMKESDLELLRQVALRHPGPATLHRYALALVLNGNTEEGKRQLFVVRTLLGESAYANIKAKWTQLAANEYPQLSGLKLP